MPQKPRSVVLNAVAQLGLVGRQNRAPKPHGQPVAGENIQRPGTTMNPEKVLHRAGSHPPAPRVGLHEELEYQEIRLRVERAGESFIPHERKAYEVGRPFE